ncbi:HEAT repeat-containing protein 1-like [Sycon ciliatum]|uniref:HEAT repeat-containing protein 1-like n=1 Tax=Sycon ciliatum TaxID=27933 RepID=UPI0031F6F2DE
MSSLAAQLKQLSTPGNLSFRSAARTKTPSLLFSEDEAADLDLETFYAHGINGLDELININPGFQSYQGTLFGEASKSFERTLQTAENNQKLDEEIWKFLLEVSPYILLKPAQKALEWLVHTFRVYAYNTDALVACTLPYHNTAVFVRVLKLLPLKSPTSRWHWLRSAQRAESPLSRFTILQQCQSVPAFLQFICDVVERAVGPSTSGYNTLVAFYTSLCVGLLNGGTLVTEQLLTQIVPSCVKSLRSNHAELKAGAFMIVGQLVVRASLEPKVVETLVDCICRHMQADMLLSAMACLVCVFQTQSAKFSKRCVRALCYQPEVVYSIAQLASSHDVSALLASFLPSVLKAALSRLSSSSSPASDSDTTVRVGKADYFSVIMEAIHILPLEASLAGVLGRVVIESYIENSQSSSAATGGQHTTEVSDKYAQLSRALNQRYPSGIDHALAAILAEFDENRDDAILEKVHDFMEMALCGTKNQVLLDRNSARILTLNHPQAPIRCLAIKQASQRLKEALSQSEPIDTNFFASAFVERLSDDDVNVCKCVLDLNKTLIKLVDFDVLWRALLQLIERCRVQSDESSWCQVAGQAVVVMSRAVAQASSTSQSGLHAVLAILQHTWLTRSHTTFSTACLQSLASSLQKASDSFLSSLHTAASKALSALKASSDASSLASANRALLDWTVTHIQSLSCPFTDVAKSIRGWYSQANAAESLCRHLSCLLLCSWLRSGKSKRAASSLVFECCQILVGLVTPLVDDIKNHADLATLKKSKELLQKASAKDLQGVLLSSVEASCDDLHHWWCTVLVLQWSVKSITCSLAMPTLLSEAAWWWSNSVLKESEEHLYLQIIRDLLPLLLDVTASVPQARCKRLWSQFSEKQGNSSHLLKALCMIWTEGLLPEQYDEDDAAEDEESNRVCLCVSKVSDIFQNEEELESLIASPSPAIPSLICSLCHHSADVRQAAVSACQALASLCAEKKLTSKEIPLLSVVNLACELVVQIGADPQVLSNTLAEKISRASGLSKVAKQWSSVMKSLVELAVCNTAPLHVKVMLLTCLEKVPSKEWLPLTRDVALHTLRQLFSSTSDKGSSRLEHDYLRHLVQCQLQAANITNNNHLIALETIETTLKECRAAASDAISACDIVLPVITPPLFLAFPTASRRQLLSIFLDKVSVLGEVRDSAAVHKCLMQFPVDGADILNELNRPGGVLSAPEESSPRKNRSKRRKVTDSSSSDVVDSSAWQRAVVLLELLQNGEEQLTNTHILMPHLFRLLSLSIEAEDETLESSEYTKQLIVSGIHTLCRAASTAAKQSKPGLLKAEDFNVECIVRCVRASSNPQTHHHALLLLATAAALFPDRVLHNIMAIFTFMGANLLRMDDSYSFDVIERTIQTVIPALVQAGTATPGGKSNGSVAIREGFLPIVVAVMRVFADAWPHMPVHRIMSVFEKLMSTLGSEGYMHYMLKLLVERYVLQPGVSAGSSLPSSMISVPSSAASSPTRDGDPSLVFCELDFPVQLCLRFDVSSQLSTLLEVVQYVGDLPVTKPDTGSKGKPKKDPKQLPLYDVAQHTEKHLQLYKINLLTIVADVLTSEEFMLPDSSPNAAAEAIHEKVLRLLEEVMAFANRQTRLSLKQTDNNLKQCLRAVCTAAYKIVSAICDQLSVEILVDVVLKLSSHKAVAVQNKALELLNAGLQKQERRPWPASQESVFVNVAERLTDIVLSRLTAGVSSASSGREELITCQSAFISLKLLTCQLAARNPQPMLKVARVVLDVISSEDCCPQVCASAILCFGESITCLGPQLIAELPRAIKALVAVLKSSWSRINPVLLQISAVTALGKMIVHLPAFLGKQLKNILRQLVHGKLCEDRSESSDSGRSNLLLRAQAARTSIAVKVPGRVLFPAIQDCFQTIAKPSKVNSMLSLVSVLSRGIQEVPKAELKDLSEVLTTLFLDMFSFIATRYNEFTESNMRTLLDKCVQCFITLVLRSSEPVFRTMFTKICNWADYQHQCSERMLIFFSLTFSLTDRLKGLFTTFGGPVVDSAVAVLAAINMKKKGNTFFSGEDTNGFGPEDDESESSDEIESDEEEEMDVSDDEGAGKALKKKSLAFPSAAWKCQQLANQCVDTMLRLFTHDSDGRLVHKQLFEEVMPPLVEQLESCRGSVQDYQQYVTDHLVPCISQLSMVVSSVPLWKQQNARLLQKAASPSPRVRFAVLSVLKELFTRLSEDYVALLPETIPVLAELLEDDSPEVEKQCKSLMKVIEEITGETAQSFF